MFSDCITLENNTQHVLRVWVEPWAFEVEVPTYDCLVFEAQSETQGSFELERNDGYAAVYAWSGCTMSIKHRIKDQWVEIWASDIAVPDSLDGMSMKETMNLMFATPTDQSPQKANGFFYKIRWLIYGGLLGFVAALIVLMLWR